MARNWTSAQSEAIFARHADLLVAAAAGSGKTAVLVERIIQRITDAEQPVDLDRLLVVTFTNAAAAEMRQRIGAALSEKLEQDPANELLSRQLALLPRASVTTIHAFCHKILRSNFNLLGLDPGFSLADPTENELIRLAALEEVIDEMYEDPIFAENFLKLTEAYLNIKHTDSFYGLINHIYDFAMSLPDPVNWLRQSAESFLAEEAKPFDETPVAVLVLDAGKGKAEAVIKKYDAMIHMADRDEGGEVLVPFLRQEQRMFQLLAGSETYSDFYRQLDKIAFKTIPTVPKGAVPRYREAIRAMRDDVKGKDVKKLTEELFFLPAEEQSELLRKLYPLMQCLSETVLRLMRRFDEKKNEKNLLNYNDLEHGCYRLFTDENGQPTELAQSVREQFDEILIDEYQDTSALQEAIFQSIKKEGGLFLVGDVKQSIYRFRNTNPLLFREKKDRYLEDAEAIERKIILSKNFRSRAEILDGINFVFSRIMSTEAGEIDYNEEEMLYPGASYPDMAKPLPAETELCLIETGEQLKDEDELETVEAEAILAAQKIQKLIESGYQVLGKDGVREIRYRDICILMRSTKNTAACFADTLSAFGIPCYSDAGSSFLQSEEITVMLSLLKIIDNPHQDIPLLSVLRSQLYSLTPDELAEIRLADRKSDFFDALTKRAEQTDRLGIRLADFLASLSDYRLKSRQMDTAELVWYLYMQTGFYEAQATLSGGALRRLNLRLLYTRAAAFSKTGLKGLYSFIRFIDEYQAIGGDYDAARSIGEEQDVVRIMSIHKSKGLEFPVVILAGTGRRFNVRDLTEKVLIHSELGYGPQYIDTDLGIVYNNAARAAVKQVMHKETLSEEMRILYVAMTRAREKLIMLGSGKNLAGQIKKCAPGAREKQVSGFFALEARSYLDWLFMALLSHPDGALLRELSETEVVVPVEDAARFALEWVMAEDLLMPQMQQAQKTDGDGLTPEPLMPMLDYAYAHQEETDLPAKITVTEVKRAMAEQEPDSVYLYPRPEFLKRHTGHITAAEAGTAMHTVLEHLNFHTCDTLQDICNQIAVLQKNGVLTEEEAKAVPKESIFLFLQSELGVRLRRAQLVKKEVTFGICADAKNLLGRPGQVMLQGMIDCVMFEEEGISIIDYKTDRGDSPEEILKNYSIQLDCYRQAAEQLYGQKVLHCYLYLFSHNTCIEMD
ncbi:MAG: helicase-exonuclease AddAB subunit AddA [Clostridia bacterium]|nr:helicase-exonuclease AddAB subunit AddA [Clostridia bacterium]